MRRYLIGFMAATLALAAPLHAQNWTTTKLNTLGVTNNLGALIILGTTGSYGNVSSATKEAAFDGNTATYFDPLAADAQNAWAGFQLRSPKIVTRIRYMGRAGQAARMNGVLFQGANTSNFSDAATLYTHVAPANWSGTNWIDVTVSSTNALRTYTYVRFISPAAASYAGNASEIEFYGADPVADLPPTPVLSFADSANWYTHLRWTAVSNVMLYEVQRMLTNEAAFSVVYADYFRAFGAVTWRDPQTLYGTAQYRVRARNNMGDSSWFSFTAAARNAATGTWFGTAGSYSGSGMTGAKVYDANIDTFFDGPDASNGNNLWTALDLGAPRAITGLRYTPRATWASRMPGGLFQAADNTNFTGAVTLHTVSGEPPYTNMTEVVLAPAVTNRYVRYLSPNNGWGNVAEVEFDLAPSSAPKAPVSLAVSRSDITNDYPILTWSNNVQNLVSSSVVYRATAPGGPYVKQTPEGLSGFTWTDTNLVVGVLYYYKVASLYTDGTAAYEGPLCSYLTYRRTERIERAWSNLTTIKPGMALLGMGSPYGGNTSVDVDKIFDSSIGTFYDSAAKNPSPGVDLGKPYAVARLRFSPRSTFVSRVEGSVLRGSNNVAGAQSVTLATLAGGVASAYTTVATTNSDTFRYVYVTRPDASDFYGNLAELELYGWPADNLTNVLTAPASMTFALQQGSLGVSWSAGANATSYRVERMSGDGSGSWATVGTVAGTSLSDPSTTYGTRTLYRVASLRNTEAGEESAYSETFSAIPYEPGSGVGLKGYYTANYTKGYRTDEALSLVQTNAVLDLSWSGSAPLIPGVASSVSNVLITWCGKLVVPHAGSYTFYVTSDDGAALRIDNQFVINDWSGHVLSTAAGTLSLAAGQHDIRVDYFQSTSAGALKLEWDGAVTRAVIPATQLIPGDRPAEDIGAWRGRTFNTPKLGYHAVDPATGGLAVYSYGADLSGASEGHHFVWQQIGGPFLLEAKVTQTIDPLTTSAKALLMVRNAIASGSAFIAPTRMGSNQLGVKGRLAVGGTITDQLSPAWQGSPSNPCWMRIKRVGQTFTASAKSAGGEWQPFYTFTDTNGVFASSLYVGFAVTSPTSTTTVPLQSAVFSEVRLVKLYGSIITVR